MCATHSFCPAVTHTGCAHGFGPEHCDLCHKAPLAKDAVGAA